MDCKQVRDAYNEYVLHKNDCAEVVLSGDGSSSAKYNCDLAKRSSQEVLHLISVSECEAAEILGQEHFY